MYNELVRECFFHPKHVGILDLQKPHSVCARVGTRPQGEFALYLAGDLPDKIKVARFKAFGNPFLIAALERLCQQVEGKTLREAKTLTHQPWVAELAIPQNHFPLVLLVEKGLQEALNRLTEELNE